MGNNLGNKGNIKHLCFGILALLALAGCADAGKDQSVKSGDTVTLDASASKVDFHGQIKKYKWKQVKPRGHKVQLLGFKTIHPTFVAPTVTEKLTLTFKLKTIERGGYISPWKTKSQVHITIQPNTSSNQAPIANVQTSTNTVKEGESISFTGSNSTDPDGNIVSYVWTDANNTTLSNSADFSHVFERAGTHTITLTVTDDEGLSASQSFTVNVAALQAPQAIIHTSATTVLVGTSIHFDANASSDADGEIVSYQWVDETNTTLSNQKTLSHSFDTSGTHIVTLVVMDDDAQENRASVDITVEALLLSVSLDVQDATLEVNETTMLSATAHYNDNTNLDVTSSVTWNIANTNILSIDSNGTIKALQSGSTNIVASVGSLRSNTVNVTVQESVYLTAITLSPNPVHLRVGQSVQVTAIGDYSDGSNIPLDIADFIMQDSNIATADATGSVEGVQAGSTFLRVSLDNVHSALVEVIVADELNTTNFNFTHFGNTYTNQIPINATLLQYDEKRFCMIAGQIKAEDGSPLSGVRVSIHQHKEYGSTLTDSNGTYTLPSEGGLQLTMRYAKQGYTTIDRKVQAPVQDWVRSPDVTMLQIDSKVTQINLSTNTAQIHSSTIVTDDRGLRATTLVFDGVTRATVIMPSGAVRILTNIAVRATEFKTPISMPSDLPKESAFTYCSDLQIDGVSDDEEVIFDAPVVMYVDNFLGFGVGEIVPVGYYDRKEGKWKASDNGVVIKLLDTDSDGIVDALDSTGDDLPNDLDGDGSYEDEVAGLKDNPDYVAGKTYWRAEMMHFTPWDYNWPYGPPEDSEDPENPDVDTDDEEPNDCKVDVSSYVTGKTRVFHEDIPVVGTDITLHYSSKRVDGYKYVIDTNIDTTNAPASTVSAVATLTVAGKVFSRSLDLGAVNQLKFE